MKTVEYTMFQKSKPYGYYPLAVEQKIEQYEIALSKVNEKYLKQVQLNNQFKEKIKKLQDELREMHLQMSSLELPDVEETIERYILDDFKNYNTAKFDDNSNDFSKNNNNNENEEYELNLVENNLSINDEFDEKENNDDFDFIIVK